MGDGVMEQAIYGARAPAARRVWRARPVFSTTGSRPRSAFARTSANGRPAWLVPAACSRSLSATAASPSSRPPTRARPDRWGSACSSCRPTCTIVSAAILSCIADQFPPNWTARGGLPALELAGAAAGAHRGRSATGPQRAAQRHAPGRRPGVSRRRPAGVRAPGARPRLIRGLWALLPTGRRGGLWPATFAFGNASGFDVLVVPRAAGPAFEGYLTEEQASDYPEGAYELRLQTAVEAGDQRRMDDLFAGRTRRAVDSDRLSPVPPGRPELPLHPDVPEAGDADRRSTAQNSLSRPPTPARRWTTANAGGLRTACNCSPSGAESTCPATRLPRR